MGSRTLVVSATLGLSILACTPLDEDPFECIGQVERGEPVSTLRVVAVTGVSKQRVAGASVRACSRVDVECLTPIAEAATDKEGA